MMCIYYVDTSVLVSYVFASDPGHDASRRILEDISIRQKQKLYASSFTLVETCNTICRKIIKERKLSLIDPLQMYVSIHKDIEDKYQFLLSLIINFLIERLNIKFVDEEAFYNFTPIDLSGLRIPKIFKKSIELSYKLSLRIKDLLHLVYAFLLSKTYGIKYFLTRDIEDFARIRNIVKQLLQMEIILIK